MADVASTASSWGMESDAHPIVDDHIELLEDTCPRLLRLRCCGRNREEREQVESWKLGK
jgi:hypothetical protein